MIYPTFPWPHLEASRVFCFILPVSKEAELSRNPSEAQHVAPLESLDLVACLAKTLRISFISNCFLVQWYMYWDVTSPTSSSELRWNLKNLSFFHVFWQDYNPPQARNLCDFGARCRHPRYLIQNEVTWLAGVKRFWQPWGWRENPSPKQIHISSYLKNWKAFFQVRKSVNHKLELA